MTDSNATVMPESASEISVPASIPPFQNHGVERVNNEEDVKQSAISFLNTFQTVDKRDVADSAVTSDHIRDQSDQMNDSNR